MLTTLLAGRSSRILHIFRSVRWASTEVVPSSTPVLPSTDLKQPKSTGQRPQLGIEVDPDHGLWAFFRKKVGSDEQVSYETIEPREAFDESGRSWTASELRRKSFKDLHTLWYVLARERNLLATQREEARRAGIGNTESLAATPRDRLCRKSMARLKYVLNERRLVYEKILATGDSPVKERPPKITDPFHWVKSRRRSLPREAR